MDSRRDSDIPLDYGVFVKAGVVILTIPMSILLPIYLVSSFLVIAGVLWIARGGWIIYLSNTSRKWPVLQGIIIENTTGRIVRPTMPGWIVDSFPIIAYRYLVGGVEYVSRRITLFPSDLRICDDPAKSPPYKDTEDFCARFPLNSVVAVHYNPESPKDGVLIVGALSRSRQHSIVFIVLGSFLLLLGGFLFFVELVK